MHNNYVDFFPFYQYRNNYIHVKVLLSTNKDKQKSVNNSEWI